MNETFYDILPSGVRLVHRQSDSPVAYVGIMVRAGTRDESERLNGMAHYIEHCVFKGTRSRTARQIIGQIEGIGGEINAYTTKEETTFYAAVPVEHFTHTLRLIADMVLHPTFPKKETDKEVGVILDEIESYNDSPSELIYDDFENLIFAGHPLGKPILGTKKTLRRISASPAVPTEWMKQQYRPDKMVVFVQGNLPFTRVQHAVAACMAELESSSASDCLAPLKLTSQVQSLSPLPADTPREAMFRKHTHQTHVMLGGLAYPLGHARQLTMYLMNNILGGGSLNSRLNLSLRESRGLVYTVESTYTPLSDTGYWCIYFASDPQNKEQCLDLILHELKRLREQPLSEGQFRKALQQLRGQMAISAENEENNVLAMAKHVLYFGYSPTWEQTFAKIQRLTPQDLSEVANQLLQEDMLFNIQYV